MVDGRIGELTKVQSDWREGPENLVQSRISNFNEALDEVRKSGAFFIEMMSLGARERTARKPILRSTSRVQFCDGWAQRGKLQNNIKGREHEIVQQGEQSGHRRRLDRTGSTRRAGNNAHTDYLESMDARKGVVSVRECRGTRHAAGLDATPELDARFPRSHRAACPVPAASRGESSAQSRCVRIRLPWSAGDAEEVDGEAHRQTFVSS